MSKEQCKVFIVDDDASVRKSLSLLLKSAGYIADSFDSAEKLLDSEAYNYVGCIILDIYMEGRTGLELQDDIRNKFETLPIIYLTGQGNVPLSVHALKKGAINFLQKPVDEEILLGAVEEALAASREKLKEITEKKQLIELLGSLTNRETEIFRLIITGKLNKQIAAELNIAEHTVKLHRGKITEKLGVKSVAEMVHIAEKLNL